MILNEEIDIIKFYRNEGPDIFGRSFKSILLYNDAELERDHSYIQWLFPLDEPSECCSTAPVLTEEEIEIMRSDEIIISNMRSAARRSSFQMGSDTIWTPPSKPTILCQVCNSASERPEVAR